MDIEKNKIYQDYNKHITTLATASILMLVTFGDKLGSGGANILFPKIAITLFVGAILSALFSQLILVGGPDRESPEYKKNTQNMLRNTFFFGWLLFSSGLMCLLIYSWGLT